MAISTRFFLSRAGAHERRSGESTRPPPMWPRFDSGQVPYVGGVAKAVDVAYALNIVILKYKINGDFWYEGNSKLHFNNIVFAFVEHRLRI